MASATFKNVNSNLTAGRDLNISIHALNGDSTIRLIATTISKTTFDDTYRTTLSARAKDTGLWLLGDDRFKDWVDSDPADGILWLIGEPGVGKTSLSSLIVKHLFSKSEKHTRVTVFLFCDHTKNLSIHDLLGSILRQLVLALPTSEAVSNWWDGGHNPLSVDDLNELIVAQIGAAAVDILTDAFDECTVRTRLLKTFRSLAKTGKARLFITGRPNMVDLITESDSRIDVESAEDDIRKFVLEQITDPKEDRFRDLADLIEGGKPVDGKPLSEFVVEQIVAKSGARILIATLHLEAIAGKDNVKQLKEALNNLSPDLHEMYDQNVARIPEKEKRLAFDVFSWVAHALDPLTVRELQYALATERQDNNSELIDEDELVPSKKILQACVGLVKSRKWAANLDTEVIVLVHETAYQYFKDATSSDSLYRTPLHMVLTCIRSMTLKVTTFQSYARRYWTWYATQLSGDEVSSLAASLKDRPYDKMAYACSYVWIDGGMWFIPWVSIPASPAHMLAWTGLEHIFQVPDDSQTTDGWTSLFFAAFAGHLNIVQALAQNHDNLEVSDKRKRSALSYAISRTGNFEVVKALVENGADVNSTSEDGRSILSYAVAGWGANPDIVRFLLQRGADVHSADINGRTALSYATAQRALANIDVIRALIENGADLNSKDKDGRTPLSYAVGSNRNDRVEVVRVLAEHGADATIQDSTGKTALSYLVEEDREAGEIAVLLQPVNTDKFEDASS